MFPFALVACRLAEFRPGGTFENSPAIHRRAPSRPKNAFRPGGTFESGDDWIKFPLMDTGTRSDSPTQR
jgi:hypothetical protein